ncbi:MAG: peroxiredoxin-like family protein [Burkholderiales bacterium]
MTIQNDSRVLWENLQTQMPADVVDKLKAGWGEIMSKGVQQTCLQAGDIAPDFALPSASGKTVRLSEALARGPAVVTFYRGAWCVFCNLALQAYQAALPEISRRGASLIAISPQTPGNSLSVQEKNALEFEVLSDQGSHVAQSYKLAFEIPQTHRSVLAQFDMPLTRMNGDDTGLIPLPATYVINPGGVIVWAHTNANYRVRAEIEDILAALDKLAQHRAPAY